MLSLVPGTQPEHGKLRVLPLPLWWVSRVGLLYQDLPVTLRPPGKIDRWATWLLPIKSFSKY